MPELPKLVLSSSDHIMHRSIDSEMDEATESNQWVLSNPIPGARIINSWEIYHGIHLVLAVTENGCYNIFRTLDLLKYTLVHEHDSRIYGLFYIDDGHMIFCADDGWWRTTKTGIEWEEFSSLCIDSPKARSVAVTAIAPGEWLLIAYAEDHKLYTCDYPNGDWVEAYDTNPLWSNKWYPALAGSPVALLAGAGNKLLRADPLGASWSTIQEVEGIIKSITASDQSNKPVFLIEVEAYDGSLSKLFWTYDAGDSLVPDMSRVGPIASVQSVYPTGANKRQTMFAVLGKRTPEGLTGYKVLEDP